MNMSHWSKFEVPKALIVVIVCHRLKLIEIKLLFLFHNAVFAIKSSGIAIAGSVVNFQEVNIPLRDYQLAITEKALFSNTLVALPTVLGKTLIVAVVMYNYFRWFPDGNEWTIDMTGQISPTNRACLWKSKRIRGSSSKIGNNDPSPTSLNSQSRSNGESHHFPLFLCLKAAAMHMEIGRRLFRQRLETGDRDGDLEERRAFQKLIYVSTLVFGDASSFLLPWKRVFKVTDSQVEIALRDNAQRLYATKLKSISTEQLFSLREAQLLYRLSDEHVADLFRKHTRKLIEKHISSALTLLKSKTRATHPDSSRFAPGVGPVFLLDCEYGDKKMDELKIFLEPMQQMHYPVVAWKNIRYQTVVFFEA
ncbi:hypothetical protein G4B88_017478 [Cannabis sativa]|uniref:Uncharacterized protein n=1 Tax=Cannabis sativa TaxID=3483 RepID=A0A7J6I3R6_CANSA|nr:hypothetical protein G4B88_017478 [Cannabis sativa]